MNRRKTVLITGACGNLGTKLSHHLQDRFDLILLDARPDGPGVWEADLRYWDEEWVGLFNGADTVVHFAATASTRAEWHEIVEPNLDAVLHVYNAATRSTVQRVIFASSNHAMGRYENIPQPETIGPLTPPRPGTRIGEGHDSLPYGALKLVGERVGKCYSDALGLSTIAVRIGWVQSGDNPLPDPSNGSEWLNRMWLSNQDFCQLFEKCITADPSIRYAVVNGMSNNAGMRWDIEHTRDVVGYKPEDGIR